MGDSGGRINIFGNANIGHCEEEVNMNMCPILDGY
jgi:hypothetical protein